MKTKVTVTYFDSSIDDMCTKEFHSSNQMDSRTKALDFAYGKKFVSINLSHYE